MCIYLIIIYSKKISKSIGVFISQTIMFKFNPINFPINSIYKYDKKREGKISKGWNYLKGQISYDNF